MSRFWTDKVFESSTAAVRSEARGVGISVASANRASVEKLLPSLDELNVLVIGATQGIGLGFVRSLLCDDRVRRVFGTYRERSTATELLSLQKEQSGRVECLQMDVTQEDQIALAFSSISEAVGELHLVLYCVGVLHEGEVSPEKSLDQLNPEHLLYQFQVNSIGAALVAKHAAPLFLRNAPSLLAAISAKVGSIGDNKLGGWYGYRASKAALNMLIRTAAIEYRRRCPNTIVLTLHPGTTNTRLSQPFQHNVPPDQLFSVERTVELLTGVLAGRVLADSGNFYSWNGSRLPW